MAGDYTKYTVAGLGENLNKRQLVFEIMEYQFNGLDGAFEEEK